MPRPHAPPVSPSLPTHAPPVSLPSIFPPHRPHPRAFRLSTFPPQPRPHPRASLPSPVSLSENAALNDELTKAWVTELPEHRLLQSS